MAQEFLEFGSRIIMIQAGDHAYATKKVKFSSNCRKKGEKNNNKKKNR